MDQLYKNHSRERSLRYFIVYEISLSSIKLKLLKILFLNNISRISLLRSSRYRLLSHFRRYIELGWLCKLCHQGSNLRYFIFYEISITGFNKNLKKNHALKSILRNAPRRLRIGRQHGRFHMCIQVGSSYKYHLQERILSKFRVYEILFSIFDIKLKKRKS